MSLGVLSLLLLASAQTPPAPAPRNVQAASNTAATFVGPPATAPEVDASGTWTGTTSQGRAIEIEVDAGNVKLVRVGWRIAFENECVAPDGRLPQRDREGVQLMRYQYPEPVRGGRLKTRMGVGSDLDLVLSAAFGSDGTASGDLDLRTVSGARCVGQLKATWKATRKPAVPAR